MMKNRRQSLVVRGLVILPAFAVTDAISGGPAFSKRLPRCADD